MEYRDRETERAWSEIHFIPMSSTLGGTSTFARKHPSMNLVQKNEELWLKLIEQEWLQVLVYLE